MNTTSSLNHTIHTSGDLGFSREGRQPWVWGENLLFGKIFAENCLKMKEKLDRDGRASLAPPLGSNYRYHQINHNHHIYFWKTLVLFAVHLNHRIDVVHHTKNQEIIELGVHYKFLFNFNRDFEVWPVVINMHYRSSTMYIVVWHVAASLHYWSSTLQLICIESLVGIGARHPEVNNTFVCVPKATVSMELYM